MSHRFAWTAGALTVLTLVGVSCSLINKLDPVVGAAGGANQGGQGQGAGSGASGGAGGTAGSGATAPYNGEDQLLVIGGENEAKQPMLMVIDPDTGDVMSESNDVRSAAVLYDPFGDQWVLFNANSLTDSGADVGGMGSAQLRRWNTTDIGWEVVTMTGGGVPMPIRPNDAVMLQDYVAYVASPSAGTIEIILASLNNLAMTDSRTIALAGNEHYVGIASYPASGTSGGHIMVFTAIEQPQTSGNCHLQVRGHAIDGMGHILGMDNPAGDPFMHEFDCGNTVIKNFPFAIANPAAPLEYYVALPRGTTKSTTIYRWRPPPGMTPPALELALGETVNSFSGGDFDLCNGDLFVGSRDNQTILPIPVGTATQPSIAQLDQVPRPIVWEPYTRRLFTFGRSLGGVMHSVSALEVDDSNVPTKLTPVAGFPMFPQMVPYAAAAKTPVLGNMDLCP